MIDMDKVRNFIHIIGTASNHELPKKIDGQIVQYSDVESILIPSDKPNANNIYEIIIELEITSTKQISIPLNNLLIVDGIRKFKIMYISDDNNKEAIMFNISKPYNTFIELPKGVYDILDVNVYIIDSYFHLVNNREIYNYNLYLVNVKYDDKEILKSVDANVGTTDDTNYEILDDFNYSSCTTDLFEKKVSAPEESGKGRHIVKKTKKIENALADI